VTFDTVTFVVLFLCFIWSGFLRTGLGVGSTVLMLPFALLVVDNPLIIIPVAATHAVFLSTITVVQNFRNVNWRYAGIFILFIFLPFVSGIYGLVSLPEKWLTLLIYTITLIYAFSYIFPMKLSVTNRFTDFLSLVIGGYINGLSFTGGPPLAAVMSKYVAKVQFRDTFLATVIFVATVKLSTLLFIGISLQPQLQLYMLPAVLLGHVLGLRFHRYFINRDDRDFYRWLGIVILMITILGFIKTLLK
jgi:hypothetical protein